MGSDFGVAAILCLHDMRFYHMMADKQSIQDVRERAAQCVSGVMVDTHASYLKTLRFGSSTFLLAVLADFRVLPELFQTLSGKYLKREYKRLFPNPYKFAPDIYLIITN